MAGEGEEEGGKVVMGKGSHSPKPAWLGMHTASFVGKIRIRLVPDPLEQSLEAFEVGLSPARKAENQFGWQTRAPKSSVHAP